MLKNNNLHIDIIIDPNSDTGKKDKANITYASQAAHWKPTPGTLIIMPAYATHQYSMGGPNQAFRFIHFNLQAVRNEILEGVKNQ